MNHPTRFVLLDKFHELTGHTPKSVYCKVDKGTWMLGREVRKKDGRLYVDLDMFDRWLATK